MAPKGIKSSKLLERKSRAKVVEWNTRERTRGTRYIPIEICASTSQQIIRKDTVRMDIVDQGEISHNINSQSMDVDEPSWVDEDVPEQTRVSSPSCPFLISFDTALSPSVATWKSLFIGLTPTWIAFSFLKASQ
jgi:hypothetical protein